MGTGKKKIEIKRREKADQRMVTFSKRRKGLFKKSHELHCLTGADIAVVAFSPAGRPYTNGGGPSFDATIDKYMNINEEEISENGGGDEGKGKKMMMMTSWLESIKVGDYESVDDLVMVKERVEEIRDNVMFGLMRNIDVEFLQSLLKG